MSLLGEEKGNTQSDLSQTVEAKRKEGERERNVSEVAEKCVSICITLCVCQSETHTKGDSSFCAFLSVENYNNPPKCCHNL